MRTVLGVAYMAAFLLAVTLPFPAFGAMGLFVLVPTALWLASGLRARARRRGDLTDGVVGWPGFTAAAFGASSFVVMTVGGRAMAAVWLASLAACGVLELARARIAKTDSVRAEFGVRVARGSTPRSDVDERPAGSRWRKNYGAIHPRTPGDTPRRRRST